MFRPPPSPLLCLVYAALPFLALQVGAIHEPGHGRSSFPRPLPPAVGERGLFLATPVDSLVPCLGATDGTPEGTAFFPECISLTGGGEIFVSFDDRKYLTARYERGPQMWATDGTAEGTYPLTDFVSFSIRDSIAVDFDTGMLAVFGDDGVHGREIWLSDGTADGRHMLLDLEPGVADSQAYGLGFHQGRLYFAGSYETPQRLWRSDHGLTTASPFFTLPDGHRLVGFPWPPADRMVLVTSDDACGHRVWSSDGTAAGTEVLADFTGGCPGAIQRVFYRSPVMYFLLDDGVHGIEVWASDGHGLQRITDLPANNPFPRRFFWPLELADGIAFIADGGDDVGVELWWTDGRPEGTRLVADICPGACSSLNEVQIPPIVDGRTYLVANDGEHGWEVWSSNGTREGTKLVTDVCPGACPEIQSTSVQATDRDFLLVRSDDGVHGQQMWRLDTDPVDVVQLTDFVGHAPSPWLGMIDLPTGIVFAAEDGTHGSELWITDGTAVGTRLLANLAADPERPSEPPVGPVGLEATATYHGGLVELRWTAGSGGGAAERWTVEARSPGFGWTVVASELVSQATPEEGWIPLSLDDDTPYTFRVRGENGAGVSPWSEEVSLTTLASYDDDPCVAGSHLCLADRRFLVQVAWRNQHAGPGAEVHGSGHPIPAAGSERSGYFWFFNPDNVELVVKVLDGTSVNGFHWTFYGALTNVEYWITVTDQRTGERRTYHNPPGEICGRGDTSSLPADSAALLSALSVTAPAAHRVLTLEAGPDAPRATTARAHPFEPCVADANTLCLLDGRFRVRVSWDDHHNHRQGVGGAVPFSDRAGFFWFFNPQNIELVVKVLDGRAVNGKIWVFYGALSDVGYTIDVTDVQDGHAVRSYENAPGNICGNADTAAF